MTDRTAYSDSDDGLKCDNSSHGYEWWHFDAHFNNGYICTIRLSWRDLSSGQPSASISIFLPDNRVVHGLDSFEMSAARATAERCDFSVGPNYARQEAPDLYRVVVRTRAAGAHLVFRRRLPGWKLTADGILTDSTPEKYGWTNAIPRAEVEGKLFLNSRQIPVRGFGYHDHCWSSGTITGGTIKSWIRGHVFDPKYTLVYGWLTSATADHKPFLYTAMGNQPIFASEEIALETGATATHQASGNTIPTDVTLRGKAPWGVEVNFRTVMTRLLAWQRSQTDNLIVDCYQKLGKSIAEVSLGAMEDRANGDSIEEYIILR